MSDLILTRVQRDAEVTIGELTIGPHHIAWTCEDPDREQPGVPVADWKVPGDTCIPIGRYRIERRWSARAGHMVLGLLDVPGFSDIEIHSGNTTTDTRGCILPGLVRRQSGVGDSVLAVAEVNKWFDAMIAKSGEAWIDVRLGAPQENA